MICEKCGNPIPENELFCKACGYEQALEQQRAKYEILRENRKLSINAMFHSRLFLASTICLTIFTALSFGSIIPFVLLLISVIGYWKCYKAKTDEDLAKGIKLAKVYDYFQMISIYITLGFEALSFAFGTVTTVIGCVQINSSYEDVYGSISPTLPITIQWIGSAVSVIIFVVIYLCINRIFKSRIEFWKSMEKSVISGDHSPASISKGGAYFLGISSFITAALLILVCIICSVVMLISSETIIISILSEIDFGSDDSWVVPLVNLTPWIFCILFLGMAIFGTLSYVSNGLYYILSAKWMASLKNSCFTFWRDQENERKALEKLEKDTASAVNIFNHIKSLDSNNTPEAEEEVVVPANEATE